MEHINALPVGTRLADYEIVGVLGQGGFGITYRAQDVNLHKVVALKEYLPRDFATRTSTRTVVPLSGSDAADYQWGLRRFVDEARTLARFDHPNLNKVHRFFEAHGTAYIVLDYIEGQTLSAVLASTPILPAATLHLLLADVLSGLEEVHAAGYVHRDIKPGNLMVRPDGSVVVVDFGAARQAVGQRSKSITSILTPGYAPIEQYDTTAADVGPWSDLYALGMVLYRSISGLRDGELPDAVTRSRAARKGSGELEPAASLGQGRYDGRLLRAIDWAIQVEEEARPQSIAQWRQALPALATGPGQAAPLSSPPALSGSGPGLPRWASVVGVLALVLAVAGGAYWYVQQPESPSSAPAEVASGSPAGEPGPTESPASQASQPVPTPRQTASARLEAEESPAAPVPVSPFTVATEPVDATVELLGIKEAYRAGLPLPVGEYQVEVRADGYDLQRVWITHEADGGPYRVALEALRQPFTIVPEPADAHIRIMNIPERYQAGRELAPGSYQVEVSAAGYESVVETIEHGTVPTERRIALARAGPRVGARFRDCPACPHMVVVPAGSFMMGSPASEADRADDEGPVHRVTIGQPFAVGVYEVTREDYERFVEATGYAGGERCRTYEAGEWREGVTWRAPGFDQTKRDPVVCVNREDTHAYVRWLSRPAQTGHAYRLLSEAEWEYVARAGMITPYHFGTTISTAQANYGRFGILASTEPVGSYAPNAFGLYDVHGNVWEWVQDCWNENYNGAPSDGRVWERGDCGRRVRRGGSWNDEPKRLRAAFRSMNTTGDRNNNFGFRVARSLP